MSDLTPDAMRARRFKTIRTVTALILREMSTTYGRSPGGYIWAVLEPVGAITVLTLGFSLVFHAPALGSSFILFYATGYLPFSMYNMLANAVSRSLFFSKALLAYPGVTYVDALLARFLLNWLTQMMVLYIVITGILVLQDTRAILEFGPILKSLAMVAVLGAGVGTMNCFLFGMFPVWEQIWSIVNRPLFIISGVFFLYDDLPTPVQNIIWFNPLLHATGLMRKGFYPTYEASYISLAYGFGFGAVFLFLGLVFVGRYHRDILTN